MADIEQRADSVESIDDEDMDMMMAGGDGETGPLFWNMKLEANKPTGIEQPAIEGYIIHITNACFGEQVQKQSRTLVFVNVDADDDEEDDDAAKSNDGSAICVLRQGSHESQSLDLLFNESAVLTLKGQKPSTVYLTGYLQPPIDDAMNSMLEDDDDEAIQRVLARQEKMGRVLDDEDDEPQLMDEADEVQPAQKKQKTAAGAIVTKNGAKPEKKKNKKNKKNADADTAPATGDDEKAEKPAAGKKDKKDKKEQKEGMLTMKGGIKYRDMKVGDGKVATHGDKLKVFYVGQTDDKQVFDKSISGTGFEFNFGKGDVIKGWEMGLKGMRVGGKRKLVIPPKLGYGSAGSPPTIPPNATLTFTIELKAAN